MLILSFVYHEYNMIKMKYYLQKTEKTDYFNVDFSYIIIMNIFYTKRYCKN